jgi:rubrerythrin
VKKLNSIHNILDFAMSTELKAYELYTDMAAMVENVWMSKALEGFAQEELRHHKKLKAVKAGRKLLKHDQVSNLDFSEMLEDVQPHPDMEYSELLAFAIRKENLSHRLYNKLASIFSEPHLKETFLRLASEEADHKRRFEMQYQSLTS